MASKYHINANTGRPNVCTASLRDCPVGGDHFDTKAEAREAYEAQMNQVTEHLASVQKEIGAKRDVKAAEAQAAREAEEARKAAFDAAVENAQSFEIVNRETGEVEATIAFSSEEQAMPGYRASVARGYDHTPQFEVRPVQDARLKGLQDAVDEATANPAFHQYGFPEDEMTRHYAGQKLRAAIKELDDYRLMKALQEGRGTVIDHRGNEYGVLQAGEGMVGLQQEIFGRRVGDEVRSSGGGRYPKVTEVHGDGTYTIQDSYGRSYRRKDYVKPTAGGLSLGSVPEGETSYPDATLVSLSVNVATSDDSYGTMERRALLVENGSAMDAAGRIKVARAAWAYSGNDLESFDSADTAQQEAWFSTLRVEEGPLKVKNTKLAWVEAASGGIPLDPHTLKVVSV